MLEKIRDSWNISGIEPGDTVLLHSNIQRTIIKYRKMGLNVTPEDILESFLQAIGPKGTLVLPLFNFDYTKGLPFNILTSPSHMGALTEVARLQKSMVRTGHPIYSFGAIGHNSKIFENVNNISAYAEDSPFGILKNINGKIAPLDLEDQHSMTFYHHIEEVKKVDYRYYKSFEGYYTDKEGVTQIRSYQIFVRKLDQGVLTNVNPTGELMWEAGLYKGYRPKVESGLRVIKSKDMFDFVANIIDSSKAHGLLYRLDNTP